MCVFVCECDSVCMYVCVYVCVMFIPLLRGGIPPGIAFSRSSINTTLGKLLFVNV